MSNPLVNQACFTVANAGVGQSVGRSGWFHQGLLKNCALGIRFDDTAPKEETRRR